MNFSSRAIGLIPPESIKKEVLEDSSEGALMTVQKVPSISDLSEENSIGKFLSLGKKKKSFSRVLFTKRQTVVPNHNYVAKSPSWLPSCCISFSFDFPML